MEGGLDFWCVPFLVICANVAQIMIIDSHCKHIKSFWIFIHFIFVLKESILLEILASVCVLEPGQTRF